MIAAALIVVALIIISGIVAVMLHAAWRDLGRPRHAQTWSVAFALATLVWIMALVAGAGWLPLWSTIALMPAIGGLASAVIAIGFRQRAGLPDRRRLVLGSTAIYAATVVALVVTQRTHPAWITPLSGWNAVMFTLAARTLQGRRQGERFAERVAEGGLLMLALLHFLVFGAMIGRAAGLLTVELGRLGMLTLLLLPSIVGGVGLFTIILLLADLADQTRRLAATDLLTGLLNRRGFDEAARALLAAVRRNRRSMALVMIDVDRFKSINDRFGHPAGDRVLQGVSTRISQGIGRRDVLARVGGEEFALILADADLQTATYAVETLRAQVEALAIDLPEPYRVTASFGVTATAPSDTDAAEEDIATLLDRADRALYRSKATGRNRVTVWDSACA